MSDQSALDKSWNELVTVAEEFRELSDEEQRTLMNNLSEEDREAFTHFLTEYDMLDSTLSHLSRFIKNDAPISITFDGDTHSVTYFEDKTRLTEITGSVT